MVTFIEFTKQVVGAELGGNIHRAKLAKVIYDFVLSMPKQKNVKQADINIDDFGKMFQDMNEHMISSKEESNKRIAELEESLKEAHVKCNQMEETVSNMQNIFDDIPPAPPVDKKTGNKKGGVQLKTQ